MLSVLWRERNLRIHCGYYMGKFDNIEGKGLKNAYLNFQRDNGLVADSIYGNATDSKLISVIKNLQQLLRNKGYNIAVDGCAGDKTYWALGDFQSKNGLAVDKIAGKNTYAKLNGSTPSGKYKCKYFKDSEFTCKCGCGLNLQKDGIKRIADEIREHFGRPMIITSGTRCAKHNKAVGGVSNSWHLKGNAIDIIINGVSANELYAYAQQIVNRGSARYTYKINSSALHIDTGNME